MSVASMTHRISCFNSAGDLISDTTQWGFDPPLSSMGGPNSNNNMDSLNYSNNNNGYIRPTYNNLDRLWKNNVDMKLHSSMPSIASIGHSPYSQTNETGQEQRHREDEGNGTTENSTTLSLESTTLEQIWSLYAKESTCHGLKNVVESCRRPWMRIAWMVIVLGMLIVLVSTIIDLLDDYKNHSTVTRTDVRIQTQPVFPSVTICNNSPYKNLNGTTDNPMFTLMAKHTILTKFLPVDFSDPEVLRLLGKSAIEVNEAYSFTKDDLFKLATYEKQYLNISRDFETVDTPSGRCFTFNGPNYIAKYGVRKANFDGRDSGLRVVVDIKQDMYVPSDGLDAGIRVFVSHHPDTPRYEKDGLDIMAGTSSRVALSPVKFQFLPYPFASYGPEYCHNMDESELLKKMIHGPFYSQQSCLLQCQILQASRLCNCYSHSLYVKDLPVCSFGHNIYCIQEKIGQMKAGNINTSCDCPRPCTFTRYNSMLSASRLSSESTMQYLSKMVNASSIKEFRENFLDIRVFLDSMVIRMESHEPRYTLSSIFGFLGGQMGFFMGASLMTIAELGETLLLTLVFFVHKLLRVGRMK